MFFTFKTHFDVYTENCMRCFCIRHVGLKLIILTETKTTSIFCGMQSFQGMISRSVLSYAYLIKSILSCCWCRFLVMVTFQIQWEIAVILLWLLNCILRERVDEDFSTSSQFTNVPDLIGWEAFVLQITLCSCKLLC